MTENHPFIAVGFVVVVVMRGCLLSIINTLLGLQYFCLATLNSRVAEPVLMYFGRLLLHGAPAPILNTIC